MQFASEVSSATFDPSGDLCRRTGRPRSASRCAKMWRRALGLAAFAFLLPRVGLCQAIDQKFWVTNGYVNAVATSGNTVYLGGGFTQVGPATGGWVAIDASTGAGLHPYPMVAGQVFACAADGFGGWFIGGAFTAVRGQARNNLAHIDASGNLTDWNPNANGPVGHLAVSAGTVYTSGNFTSIGGQTRRSIAALDATTGAATAWNPNPNQVGVAALAVSGGTVYVGGTFTSIGGQARNNVAAFDATTGAATAWNPNADGEVWALVVSGGTVYAGGVFTSIGGKVRNDLAALDATTGAATGWNPNPSPYPLIHALAVSEGTVYVGGQFTSIGGQARSNLAALDATTGAATAWNPNVSDPVEAIVQALAVSGGTVYVGGSFTNIGGQARNNLAALDATTGAATAWDPNANDQVDALAISGGVVYAGGYFTSIGGKVRHNLAAFDATAGAATAWNPNADYEVRALVVSARTIYAGGDFDSIGGQARSGLAALDATTGAATAWNPNADGGVRALAVSGGTVYAGGGFTSIGGQARSNLAALDATTGAATAWSPNANSYVNALAVSGSTVYAGGGFASIGGQARNLIAALDATSGAATAWNPNPDDLNSQGTVNALAVSGGTVYAGGYFGIIGGQVRSCLAALDATTGAATAWNPSANGGVWALALSGGTVYAGGYFTSISGQPRNLVAALDAASGAAVAWDPNNPPNNSNTSGRSVYLALAVRGGTVYAGGTFSGIGVHPQVGIAAIEAFETAPDCSDAAAVPAQLWPPDHRLVPVAITGVTDADGDPVKITVTRVTQDEPLGEGQADDGHGRDRRGEALSGAAPAVDDEHGKDHRPGQGRDDGRDCGDAVIDDSGGVSLRAARSDRSNGRVYTIWFTASDGRGGSCGDSVQVCVPHDHQHPACVDDGQKFNSLGPCPDRGHGHDRAGLAEVTLAAVAHAGSTPTLEYALPEASDVRISVFDIAGRRVMSLVTAAQSAGSHSVPWNTSGLARGMYFCRLQAGRSVVTKPLLVLK